MTEAWLSSSNITAHICVMKDTVDAWIAKKRMPAHKVGRLWKSQVGKINEWRGMAALERANEE